MSSTLISLFCFCVFLVNSGEMLQWDLCKQGKKFQVLGGSKHARGHSRLVFNVVSTGPDYNTLCTSSMDRHIVVWDMTTLKAKFNIPTLGGFAYCLALSPVHPGKMFYLLFEIQVLFKKLVTQKYKYAGSSKQNLMEELY